MTNRGHLAMVVMISLGLSALPHAARAWGAEGHIVVADIAEAHLAPEAKRQVTELLALDRVTRLRQIANWADVVIDDQPETATWHFVDIPVEERSYDQQRDCADAQCVVEQIRVQGATLARHDAAQRDRLTALKWIVHLTADIHQPLHVTDRRDAGGNKVAVCLRDQAMPKPGSTGVGLRPRIEIRCPIGEHGATLHHVWDDDLLWAIDTDPARMAAALNGAIQAADVKNWSVSRPQDWANEAHSLGRSIAYGKLPAPANGAVEIDTFYMAVSTPAIETMLAKAGVRLAGILNAALR